VNSLGTGGEGGRELSALRSWLREQNNEVGYGDIWLAAREVCQLSQCDDRIGGGGGWLGIILIINNNNNNRDVWKGSNI
jgi:hypothetical protein